MRTRASRTVAVVASATVVAAMTSPATPASAAETERGDRRTPNVATTERTLPEGGATALPRGLAKRSGGSGDAEPGDALPAGVPSTGSYAFLLKLSARTTATAFKGALGQGKSAARSAARSQLATVRSAQQRAIEQLPEKSKVLYRTHAVLSGVAVVTDVRNYDRLQRISGVASVHPIAPKTPSNSYAVPFQGTDAAWAAHSNRGEDASIAVVDTGIDYSHANFGGPGTTEAFKASAALKGQPTGPVTFPNDKVIGGYDLVGDDYDADAPATSVPVPDPWPLDCQGHGTHVAGSAAGFGVTRDGSTYAGAYDRSTDFDAMRIGPGTAPKAKLYALRVFGCDGSTNVVTQAIDRAADPNGDGDTSDHADVVNMSLGSEFGSPNDADSVATNAAAELGMVMVVSAGNSGDQYDVGGSPGNATRALTVASSQDAFSQVDALTVTSPDGIADDYAASRSVAYDWADQPAGDVTGEVVRVTQADNLDGCAPLDADAAAAVRGKVAFVEWDSNDETRRCGSVGRSNNLVAAGASGFIFGSDEEAFSAGITGSSQIPGVLLAKSGADKVRAALVAGDTVTVGGTKASGFRQLDEGLNDTLSGFSSRGGGDAGRVKPDIAAVGGSVFSAAVGTGSEGADSSGTSMAAPMVAGAAALVRTAHPDWSTEQAKAALMNTAGQDVFTGSGRTGKKYAPARVGAGRMQVDRALDNDVLAYVTDDAGAVSASFGPLAVTEPTTLTKTIKVQNTGLSKRTYDVSYEARSAVPGAAYSVSPSTITVGPRSSQEVTLTLTLDPEALTKTIDPTVSREQAGLPRHYEADASGLVLFSSDGAPQLRIPAYAAPRPASEMTQQESVTMSDTGVEEKLLPLTGSKVNQGRGAEQVQSLVSGFALHAVSEKAPRCTSTLLTGCVGYEEQRMADLKYVGATSSAPQVQADGDDPLSSSQGLAYFAISTHSPWRTAASSHEFDVFIDGDGDGVADAVAYNGRDGETDVLFSTLVDLTGSKPKIVDQQLVNDAFGDTDTALLDSDTVVLPVLIGAIPGITAEQSRISYAVQAYSPDSPDPIDSVGTVGPDLSLVDAPSFDVLNPSVTLVGSYTGEGSPVLYPDSPASVLKLRRDAESYEADGALGAMVVHFHNAVGEKAQVVRFRSAPSVSLTLSPSRADRGEQVTATVEVAPGKAGPATGEVVLKQGDTTLATGTVVDGRATMDFAIDRAGSYALRAEYAGDAGHEPATSEPVQLTVDKSRASVSMQVGPNPVRPRKQVTATVRVATVAGVPATGQVSVVRTNGEVLGRATLRDGVAVVRFRSGAKGRKVIRAEYAGDANYLAGRSGTTTLRVR